MKVEHKKGTSWLRPHHYYYGLLLAAAALVLALQLLVGAARLPSPATRLMRRGSSSEQALLDHIVHLNNLNHVCFNAKDTVIPWQANSSDMASVWHRPTSTTPDAALLEYLAQCPEIDIYLPKGLRNYGYCEDGMAYVKFLHSRALPEWVLDLRFDYQGRTNMTYLELCPTSAILFMNHYIEGVPDRSDFPKTKKIVLMPNVEMFELKENEYHHADFVLCKTVDAYERLSQWYEDFGNPRGTQVLYVQHTSSDPSTVARLHALSHPELPPIKPKDFNNITFFHAGGHSAQKSTRNVFECWRQRPHLPPIDVYSVNPDTKADFDGVFGDDGPPRSVRFHYGEDIEGPVFGRLLLEASVILCPSKMEGYGHYINQARASGALVLTTNGPPMNEFVAPGAGVLIKARTMKPNPNQLLSMYGAMEWDVPSDWICDAVETVLAMTPDERARSGRNGRRLYEKQLREFQANMRKLRTAFVL
ncbi:hypothetical protein SPRG_00804 [Saprolegnia parasitica CBS 223.65]|uniref:Glycosyl transferase family 1 domain-containing protein n=1 Tax=Saprolegnia parasitica (strain CBS 223.65) TaxID=695850 RepID=A0A067D6X1_SAPPC|nr:hypothetical protein SPRG_00804 [Saprolegnia parasitica CBS 223.65]KDO34742.1 hypothetical protein SPRG_00804 [Saprolegnia parasitica CBS 223.65]|eukprot:XP_012194411.1 hypothetical protein SPRG_00804 [Saprolegnia parasitica CBS 223.65]